MCLIIFVFHYTLRPLLNTFVTFRFPIPSIQGEHQPAKKQTSCSKCPAGTVADGSGNAQCTPCGPGGYSPSDGGTECTPCADLQFNMLSQQATCHRCGANSFSEEHARNQCLCEEGYYKLSESPLPIERTVCINILIYHILCLSAY